MGDENDSAATSPKTDLSASGWRVPASFAQERLWFLQTLEPGSTVYNLMVRLPLPQPLDDQALGLALKDLVSRHEILRTTFAGSEETVQQVVHADLPFELRSSDLSDLSDAEADGALRRLADETVSLPFDLSAGPLFRPHLIRLPGDRHELLVIVHHIIFDQWSAGILRRDLTALYRKRWGVEETSLPALPIQYADYAAWQRESLTAELVDEQLSYWRTRLAEMPGLALPTDHHRSATRTSAGAAIPFTVSKETTDRLEHLSVQAGASLFMTLLAGLQALLARYCRQDDLAIGIPVSGRHHPGIEQLIGFFVNTLVIRSRISPQETVLDLVSQIRDTMLEAFDHQDIPFETLVEAVNPQRSIGRNPLFDVMLSFRTEDGLRTSPGHSELTACAFGPATSKFDLTFDLVAANGAIEGTIEYSRELFERATVKRLAELYCTVLEALGETPGRSVWELPLLKDAERDRLLTVPAESSVGHETPGVLVHEAVSTQARRAPDAVAVIADGQRLTYRDLDSRADRLAHQLTSLGVGRESVVLLRLPRAPVLIVSMLGVLKAGASFLIAPADRALDIPETGRTIGDFDAVLIHDDLVDELPDDHRLVVTIDDLADFPRTHGQPTRFPVFALLSPDSAACVVRDASAERVVLSHSALATLAAAADGPGGGAARTRTLRHRTDTDSFVTEVWAALSGGHRLVMLPDTVDVSDSILRRNFAALTTDLGAPEFLGRISGLPLPGTTCYVLEPNLQPAPVGGVGELHIGGAGIGRGYLDHAHLTAARFIADPYAADGSRLFRTGTPARWRADGRLDIFSGRGPTAQVAPDKAPTPPTTVRRLVAYVVPAPGRTPPSDDELRAFLRSQLPEVMIPAAFVSLPELPLTASGKVDHDVLPAPPATHPGFAEPATPTERALADIWRRVLKIDRVGANDDFFALGGHSLLAARIVARVRAELNVEVPLGSVFEAPTLRAFATEIDGASHAPPLPPIEKADRELPLALSFAQQRLWFLGQLQSGSAEYNVPLALELSGELDETALGRAIDEIVSRHEILRTTIATDSEGTPIQVVHPPAPVDLPLIDLSALPTGEARARARQLNDDDAATSFDLAAAPPMRARLLRLSEAAHVLGVTFHHIASDEWSTTIFTRELSALYEAYRHGRPSPLVPVPVQYADYAAWQRDRLAGEALTHQLDYWRRKLADLPILDLPSDRARPRERDPAGALYTFTLPAELTQGIQELTLHAGCTTFMTLLAAFQVLLARYTATDDIAVGTPVAGRAHPDTENLIGFFVNTVVLRTDLSGDPTFLDLLTRVRETALDAYAHQDVPFEQIVDALQPVRDRGRNPLFDIMFGYDAADDSDGAPATAPSSSLTDLDLCSFPADRTTSKFDLSLDFFPFQGELRGRVRYRTGVLDAHWVERMTTHLRTLLEAVVADPKTRISDIELMGQDERARLTRWEHGRRAPVRPGLVHELIAAQAAATPDRTALIAAGESLTYRDLDERANRLAHHLQTLGAEPETVVGVCLNRGHQLITALLAIWKSGAVYLPLDPHNPPGRTSFQMEDSAVSIVITSNDLRDRVESGAVRLLLIDEPASLDMIDRWPSQPPPCHVQAENAAYLIYTSGSTGSPKAVVTRHGGLLNRLLWQIDAHAYTTADRVLHKDRIAFDVSLWELCCPLLAGATVVMAPPETERDPAALCRFIDDEGITVTRFVASMLDAFLDVIRPDQCAGLRFILCGGEAVPGSLARRWHRRFGHGTTLRIGYGPTEASIGVSEYRLEHEPEEDRTAPIGVPVANTRLLVLDRQLRPVPPGAPGELFIAGPQLARGYHGRPALTAERFVPDPTAGNGSRLYRTGDLARWRRDGQLEFLGRTDDQIKIRGHRVEPAEIETVLNAHESVAKAVVIARSEPRRSVRLLAYLVPSSGACPGTRELQDFLATRLPDHMIPEAFTVLDALPLTISGKIDRNALPDPEPPPVAVSAHEPPRTPTERAVADIWAEVLGADEIGAHDNFFELGGHSLLAVRVVTRVRTRFGIELPVARLFDTPVLSRYSAVVERAVIEEIRRMSDDEARRLLSGKGDDR
ncbi:amino acid adenylation domain-containing protein [Actinomadura nitritigenes]|uniref:amino acid adenylation domain-containing protein n=1 Tax=Actinomadura nitritigenes TaxID=134602 RepID=UPI003D943BF0